MKASLIVCYPSRRVCLLTVEAETVRRWTYEGSPVVEAGEDVYLLDPRCMILSDTPGLSYDARLQPALPAWARRWLKKNPWWTWEAAREMALSAFAGGRAAECRSPERGTAKETVH